MPLPAFLKPENGPFGSAVGTWLDFAPSGVSTRFFLLSFVIFYTAFQIISFSSIGLNPDLLELYSWSLHPAAGYYKHPPLGALITAGWFAIFPPTDWAFHLLAMANAAVGLYAVSLIARRYLGGDKMLVVLLLLLLTPFYQFHGQRFASNQTLLSTWPLATYCFLRAFESRGLVWSVAAGATAALAMLGKYYSIFLLAGFIVAALAHPARWRYLRSPSPWLSVLVGGLVLAPHVQWLFATGFPPFAYATSIHTSAAFGHVLWKDAVYLFEGVAYVGPLLAVYWLAVRPDRATVRETFWPSDPDGRMLIVLLAVPLLLPAIVAPFIGAVLTPLWTMSAWFLLPVVLLRPAAAKLTRIAAVRIAALVVAITVVALAIALWLAWRYHVDGTKEDRAYYRQVSAQVTDAWHLANIVPLRIVMGDPNLVLAVTFYSPDHPDSVPNYMLDTAPWVTEERLAREGWAAVCTADDQNCIGEASRRIGGRTDPQFINFATTARFMGTPSKLGRFTFILVPPRTAPRVLIK